VLVDHADAGGDRVGRGADLDESWLAAILISPESAS
jgi:hypothetical protein